MNKWIIPFLLVMALLLAAGCSKQSTTPGVDVSNLNLEDDFGGYTATTEKAGFGDETLLADLEGDVEFDDPLMTNPFIDSLNRDPQVGLYHLRVVWGQLRYDSTVTDVTDWSGSLSISHGAEVVRRLIRFEPGQDYVLERTDRKVVEWISFTTVHHDGLAIDILIPPPCPIFDTSFVDGEDEYGNPIQVIVVDTVFSDLEPVSVTFETGPYSRVFDLEELQSLDTIVYLEDSNAVAFHAFKLNRFPCPRGFLEGSWGVNEEGENVFRGHWISQHGRIEGYLQGHYGINSENERVFFGKWISESGDFEGFLKGTYGAHPNENANERAHQRAGGWFKGKIFNVNEIPIGILKGKYRSCECSDGGFFQGRWKIWCQDSQLGPDDENEGF